MATAAVMLSSKEEAEDDCGPADPHFRCLCLQDVQVLIPLTPASFFLRFCLFMFPLGFEVLVKINIQRTASLVTDTRPFATTQ